MLFLFFKYFSGLKILVIIFYDFMPGESPVNDYSIDLFV